MKNFLIFISLVFSNICFAQKNTPSNADDGPYTITEQMPCFKGGDQAMIKFIQKNIKYPQAEKEAGISGTSYVNFIVEKNGKLSGIKKFKGCFGRPGLRQVFRLE